jgi:hypothetical protein
VRSGDMQRSKFWRRAESPVIPREARGLGERFSPERDPSGWRLFSCPHSLKQQAQRFRHVRPAFAPWT